MHKGRDGDRALLGRRDTAWSGAAYRDCRGTWHTGNICQQSPVATQSAEALRAICAMVVIDTNALETVC